MTRLVLAGGLRQPDLQQRSSSGHQRGSGSYLPPVLGDPWTFFSMAQQSSAYQSTKEYLTNSHALLCINTCDSSLLKKDNSQRVDVQKGMHDIVTFLPRATS